MISPMTRPISFCVMVPSGGQLVRDMVVDFFLGHLLREEFLDNGQLPRLDVDQVLAAAFLEFLDGFAAAFRRAAHDLEHDARR